MAEVKTELLPLLSLNNGVVLPRCQRCHKEMGTEQVSG